MVLAVEHADGTAATVQLAGRAGHKFYSGWLSEEERLDQTRYHTRKVVLQDSFWVRTGCVQPCSTLVSTAEDVEDGLPCGVTLNTPDS